MAQIWILSKVRVLSKVQICKIRHLIKHALIKCVNLAKCTLTNPLLARCISTKAHQANEPLKIYRNNSLKSLKLVFVGILATKS